MQCPKCGAELENGETLRLCPQCACDLAGARRTAVVRKFGRFGLSLILGMPVMLLCGALWALLAAGTGHEYSYAAIGIGAAAGAVVAFTAGERRMAAGLVAAVLALFGLLAGKVMTAEYYIYRYPAEFAAAMDSAAVAKEELPEMTYEYIQFQYDAGAWQTPFSAELADLPPEDPAFAQRAAAAFTVFTDQKRHAEEANAGFRKNIPAEVADYYAEQKKLNILFNAEVDRGLISVDCSGEYQELPDRDFTEYNPEQQHVWLRFMYSFFDSYSRLRENFRAMTPQDRRAAITAAVTALNDFSIEERLGIYAGGLSPYDLLFALAALVVAWGIAGRKSPGNGQDHAETHGRN